MAVLEVWGARGHDVVVVDGARYSIGKSRNADLSLPGDTSVSRLHAMLEEVSGTWLVRDLGSRNGTFVNGERVLGDRVLHDGDELLVGRTRVVYRNPNERRAPDDATTEGTVSSPALTRREREVLLELCRPLLTGNAFTQPALARDIAEALSVTEAAVKQHLGRLYDKFGILDDEAGPRRVQLANEALQRGALTVIDLRGRMTPT
jgi:pSer/pThr/pTyr-binding forkhead associated (FHA) protein